MFNGTFIGCGGGGGGGGAPGPPGPPPCSLRPPILCAPGELMLLGVEIGGGGGGAAAAVEVAEAAAAAASSWCRSRPTRPPVDIFRYILPI